MVSQQPASAGSDRPGFPLKRIAPRAGAFSLSSQGDIVVGDITIGEITGRDKIVNTIQHIYQQALSAAEAAAQARSLERQLLAQGVGAFAERLRARASEQGRAVTPYRGLLEYRLSDTELFFGRGQATSELLQRLTSSPLTILHAESGAGKTSLLQAGVAPYVLAASHLPIYLRPYDTNPTLAIKRAFVADLSDAPGLAAAPLHEFLRQVTAVLGARSKLFIMLDQFEEFFTTVAEGERTSFVGELAGCLDDPGLAVHWVLALRSEYFGSLATFRPRIRNPFASDYRLGRLTRGEAEAVITKPARRLGVSFEEGLVATLLHHLGENEVAPPQIQLVCSALYEELRPGETQITRAIYEREGGAAGILRGHLERVLGRDLPAAQRSAARRLLEALTSSDKRRVVRSHPELLAELSARGVAPAMFEATLAHLVDTRLLKVQQVESGLVYELAHDYLLNEITLDPEIQARKAIQELLEQEVRAFRQFKTLLTAERLALIEPHRTELCLGTDAERLLDESQAAAQRQQAEAEARQERELRALRRLAQAQSAHLHGREHSLDRGSSQLSTWFWRVVWVALLVTLLLSWVSPIFLQGTVVLATLLFLSWVLHVARAIDRLRPRAQALPDAAFSPDGARVVTINGPCVRVWDVAGSELHQTFCKDTQAATFSPDGAQILLTGQGQSALLWDLKEQRPRPLGTNVLPRSAAPAKASGAFSPDGQTIMTSTLAGYSHLWEPSGQLRRAVAGGGQGVFSPDGRYFVTRSSDTARLWTAEGDIVAVMRGHNGEVLATAFSPDSRWIATASADRTARVWDLEGQLVAALKGHTDEVTAVSFSPDGEQLITASRDHTARIWERSGALRATLDEHDQPLISAAYNPDGAQILTASGDGAAKLYTASGRFQSSLDHVAVSWDGPKLCAARYSPDGRHIITIGAGYAIIWDRAGHALARLKTTSNEYSASTGDGGDGSGDCGGGDSSGGGDCGGGDGGVGADTAAAAMAGVAAAVRA